MVAAARVLQKSCGLSVLATLASQVGLASLFCFATLARLTRLAKVARLDKPQLFWALMLPATIGAKHSFWHSQ